MTNGKAINNGFLQTRLSATQLGQKTSASKEDMVTMMEICAKTNAVALTSLKRPKYREKLTRALMAKLNDFEDTKKRMT